MEANLFDPERSLDQALRVCDALAFHNGTTLQVTQRVDSAHVSGDADRLSQVLINLISNAIKYNNAPSPTVWIRSFIDGPHYCVEISDNGAGIPEAEQPRIFDKFYRGQRGRAAAYAGAGLGLPISREILARMRGTLELVPSAAEGACFCMRLPLEVDARATG